MRTSAGVQYSIQKQDSVNIEIPNFDQKRTCCFTGHRPNKLFGYDPYANGNKQLLNHLRKEIESLIVNRGYDTFITGMALGTDMWAARIVLSLKNKYPHIRLIAAIPCEGQPQQWPQESQKQHADILKQCDYSHVIATHYTPACMQKRNEWMVDRSSFILSVWDGTSGGTGNCINYAKRNNVAFINTNPNHFKPYTR